MPLHQAINNMGISGIYTHMEPLYIIVANGQGHLDEGALFICAILCQHLRHLREIFPADLAD
jgi:hypothetical protein